MVMDSKSNQPTLDMNNINDVTFLGKAERVKVRFHLLFYLMKSVLQLSKFRNLFIYLFVC